MGAGAAAMMDSYKRLGYYDMLHHPPPGVDVHIVRAANSDRWGRRELQQLQELGGGGGSDVPHQAPEQHVQVHVHVLPKAGHWLHVENPDGLMRLIAPSLAAVAGETP